MSEKEKKYRFETISIHGGLQPDPKQVQELYQFIKIMLINLKIQSMQPIYLD